MSEHPDSNQVTRTAAADVQNIEHPVGEDEGDDVTLGFLISRRISVEDAIGYWVAQVADGIVGALVLFEASEVASATNAGGLDS